MVAQAGYEITHTFCPLCLFDPKLGWGQRMLYVHTILFLSPGVDLDARHFAGRPAMLQHIVSHAKENNQFKLDKYLHCGFLACEDEEDPDATYVSFTNDQTK